MADDEPEHQAPARDGRADQRAPESIGGDARQPAIDKRGADHQQRPRQAADDVQQCQRFQPAAPRRRAGIGWWRHPPRWWRPRSEEHTSELQSLMRISYAVFCLKKKTQSKTPRKTKNIRPKHKKRKQR